MKRREALQLLMAATAAMTLAAPASAQTLDKFPFRLNWTLYGEHAPFFVALDKGFYKDAGLDVEIQEGSGSTTVLQLTANATSLVAYVDAATMMRGVNAGMPVKAARRDATAEPDVVHLPRRQSEAEQRFWNKCSRIAITAGDASLAIFTAFMGKLNMKVSDVNLVTVANPAAKEQAVLGGQADSLLGYFMDQGPRMQLKSGVKMGWTKLFDLAAISTLSSAIVVNENWLKEQGLACCFLAASQRGWDYTRQHPDEAAALFIKHAPAFNMEIALLEINGTLTITNTEHTKGKPLFWSAKEDWQESQDLLEKYAGLSAQADLGKYYTNEYPAAPPTRPRRSKCVDDESRRTPGRLLRPPLEGRVDRDGQSAASCVALGVG